MTTGREVLALTPIADDAEVGRWLAALEHARRDTLRELEGVTREMVDWEILEMTDEPPEIHRIRSFERYDASPDWVLHHILQHEAEHRSHIAWLRDTYAGS
jgi:hypothetical protein